jgi:hypothetical protein
MVAFHSSASKLLSTAVVLCIVLFLIATTISGYNYYSVLHTWFVPVQEMPEHLTTADAQFTIGYYAIKQTHEPLFRQEDGQNYTSRLLKSWQRNPSSTQFTFCPDNTLSFNAEHKFTGDYFERYITSVTAKFTKDFSVTRQDSCFYINFKTAMQDYLSFLTTYENAPTIPRTANIEDGLGPFQTQSLSKTDIVLYRKQPVQHGFNKIVFHMHPANTGFLAEMRSNTDFNFMQAKDIPSNIKGTYTSIYNMELASIILTISHPTPDVRNLLYNCIDINALSTALVAKASNFHNIRTILPVGMAGAEIGRPSQDCASALTNAAHKTTTITFANYYLDRQKDLSAFFLGVSHKTGLDIKVVPVSSQDLQEAANTDTLTRNLDTIYISTVRPDYDIFFSLFLNDPAYNNFDTSKLRKMFHQLHSIHDELGKEQIARNMADELASQHVALPLYQNGGLLYFPPNIKNLVLGRGTMEYPDVGDLRW